MIKRAVSEYYETALRHAGQYVFWHRLPALDGNAPRQTDQASARRAKNKFIYNYLYSIMLGQGVQMIIPYSS